MTTPPPDESDETGDRPAGKAADQPRCRFDLAPPRNFVYPALLLLLLEEPRHGYHLVGQLPALGFGPVDRPSVYRALSQLEHDGLLDSWTEPATSGPARHVYSLTAKGEEVVRSWMSIVAEERERLGDVLRRYADARGAPADA